MEPKYGKYTIITTKHIYGLDNNIYPECDIAVGVNYYLCRPAFLSNLLEIARTYNPIDAVAAFPSIYGFLLFSLEDRPGFSSSISLLCVFPHSSDFKFSRRFLKTTFVNKYEERELSDAINYSLYKVLKQHDNSHDIFDKQN